MTDEEIGTDDMPARLELVQNLEAGTGPSNGGVYISLWEQEEGELYVHYSTNFTNDPLYPSLAVNGGFDPVNWTLTIPAPEPRYLFDNLKDRILYGQ